MSPVRGGVVAACALAAAVALAGCADPAPPGQLPDGGATSTPSTSAGTASAEGAEAQILTDYLAYWDGVILAHRMANPAQPELARHATGAELTKVRGAVTRNRLQHISIRGDVRHQPTVQSAAGAAAVVEDCYDVSEWDPVDTRTGKPIAAVEQGGTGRYRARFTLRRAAGGWMVVSSSTLGAC